MNLCMNTQTHTLCMNTHTHTLPSPTPPHTLHNTHTQYTHTHTHRHTRTCTQTHKAQFHEEYGKIAARKFLQRQLGTQLPSCANLPTNSYQISTYAPLLKEDEDKLSSMGGGGGASVKDSGGGAGAGGVGGGGGAVHASWRDVCDAAAPTRSQTGAGGSEKSKGICPREKALSRGLSLSASQLSWKAKGWD
jgi:hypothetical protein